MIMINEMKAITMDSFQKKIILQPNDGQVCVLLFHPSTSIQEMLTTLSLIRGIEY